MVKILGIIVDDFLINYKLLAMSFKKYLLILSLFLFNSLNSQTSEIIDSSYQEYFKKTREIPHLHLNKTSFLSGENIWFQAYVLDQNSEQLHNATSNLYVSIFDENSNLKDQHLIPIENGIGSGNILIDSTFTNETYYIKASTNWMKNFNEDNAYFQKIEIIKDESSEKNSQKNEKYDFQLFPEGGHLLANTYNKIGILIKDGNNKGIRIKKGHVKDENGNVIDSFSTNQFGIGMAFLPFNENQKYIFEAITKENQKIEAHTPTVEKLGITLNLANDIENNRFLLNIATNSNTLKNIKEKKYKIFIHNTRKYIQSFIDFKEDKKEYSFILEKNNILEGINIITVFNEENKPILERLFFNESSRILSNSLKTSIENTNYDSIKIKIQNNHKGKISLSTSFLPLKTKAYNPENSIASSFLLTPFISGAIENPNYYFTSANKNRLTDLDLLLLTQGWSKYKWDDIFNNPPSEVYKFENGIDITLKISQKVATDNIFVINSDENKFHGALPFTKENIYTIKNSFFIKNSTIHFSMKKNNNFYKIGPSLSFSSHSLSDKLNLTQQKAIFKNSNFSSLLENDSFSIEEKNSIKNESKSSNFTYNYTTSRWSTYPIRKRIPVIEYKQKTCRNFIEQNGLYTLEGISNPAEVYFSDKIIKEFYEYKLPIGFMSKKEYYAPKYPSFNEESYLNYGAIFWKPNIEIDANSFIEFHIPNNNQKNIVLQIEGIDNQGNFLTEKITFEN